MKFYSFFFALFLIFSTTTLAQKSKAKENKKTLKSIDSLTKDFPKQEGLINTYFKEGVVFFEIDQELLDRDLLMVSRFVQFPSNFQAYQNAGSKTNEQVIHFSKKGKQILLTQKSFINIADNKDPIALSVAQNNFPPILATFPIKNKETDQFLIDVSSYFNQDSPGFNIIRASQKKEFGIANVDSKRSFIDSIKSFPKNIEIRHTLTYKASKAPRNNRTQTLSFQVNHSIILLPEELMPVRYEDPRVGWFTLRKYNYSSDALKSDEIRIIRRWRLEPKDKEAYARGELVEPIKPIVYYLDPATPMKWRPYFKKGIED